MRFALLLVLVVLSSACAGPSPLAPTARPDPAAPPAIVLTELRSYYEPLNVYAGSSTQIHVGTFGRGADGTIRAVDGLACQFSTDGGTLEPAAAGADTSWHVAIVTVPKSLGGQRITVRAVCDALAADVAFVVIPEGIHPGPPPPPPAGVGGGTGGTGGTT